jgi:hypothetical protein
MVQNFKTVLCVGPSMRSQMGYVNLIYGVVDPDFVCVGDVVGFFRKTWLGNKRVMHRVIDIDAEGNIFIKGDNAREVDCVRFSKVFFRMLRSKKII